MRISWAAGQCPTCTTKVGHTEQLVQEAVQLYIDFVPREVGMRSVPPPPFLFVLCIWGWAEWLSTVVPVRAGLIRTHKSLFGSGKVRDTRSMRVIPAR